jgi:hypothetical protein
MSMLVAARRGATEWLGATNAHATERTQAMRVERIIFYVRRRRR